MEESAFEALRKSSDEAMEKLRQRVANYPTAGLMGYRQTPSVTGGFPEEDFSASNFGAGAKSPYPELMGEAGSEEFKLSVAQRMMAGRPDMGIPGYSEDDLVSLANTDRDKFEELVSFHSRTEERGFIGETVTSTYQGLFDTADMFGGLLDNLGVINYSGSLGREGIEEQARYGETEPGRRPSQTQYAKLAKAQADLEDNNYNFESISNMFQAWGPEVGGVVVSSYAAALPGMIAGGPLGLMFAGASAAGKVSTGVKAAVSAYNGIKRGAATAKVLQAQKLGRARNIGSTLGAMTSVGILFGNEAGDRAFNTAIEEGADYEEALKYSWLQGATAGVGESITGFLIGNILRPVVKVGNAGNAFSKVFGDITQSSAIEKGWAAGANLLVELGQEGGQEMLERGIEQAYGYDKDGLTVWQSAVPVIAPTLLFGGLMGASAYVQEGKALESFQKIAHQNYNVLINRNEAGQPVQTTKEQKLSAIAQLDQLLQQGSVKGQSRADYLKAVESLTDYAVAMVEMTDGRVPVFVPEQIKKSRDEDWAKLLATDPDLKEYQRLLQDPDYQGKLKALLSGGKKGKFSGVVQGARAQYAEERTAERGIRSTGREVRTRKYTNVLDPSGEKITYTQPRLTPPAREKRMGIVKQVRETLAAGGVRRQQDRVIEGYAEQIQLALTEIEKEVKDGILDERQARELTSLVKGDRYMYDVAEGEYANSTVLKHLIAPDIYHLGMGVKPKKKTIGSGQDIANAIAFRDATRALVSYRTAKENNALGWKDLKADKAGFKQMMEQYPDLKSPPVLEALGFTQKQISELTGIDVKTEAEKPSEVVVASSYKSTRPKTTPEKATGEPVKPAEARSGKAGTGVASEPEVSAAVATEASTEVEPAAEAKPTEPTEEAQKQFELGNDYEFGRNGVEEDYEAAVKAYRIAADAGHVGAIAALGYMYEQGAGVDENLNEAMRLYRKAAEQGHVVAQYNVGVLLYNEEDYTNATEWLRKAAAQGYKDAKELLAEIKEILAEEEAKPTEAKPAGVVQPKTDEQARKEEAQATAGQQVLDEAAEREKALKPRSVVQEKAAKNVEESKKQDKDVTTRFEKKVTKVIDEVVKESPRGIDPLRAIEAREVRSDSGTVRLAPEARKEGFPPGVLHATPYMPSRHWRSGLNDFMKWGIGVSGLSDESLLASVYNVLDEKMGGRLTPRTVVGADQPQNKDFVIAMDRSKPDGERQEAMTRWVKGWTTRAADREAARQAEAELAKALDEYVTSNPFRNIWHFALSKAEREQIVKDAQEWIREYGSEKKQGNRRLKEALGWANMRELKKRLLQARKAREDSALHALKFQIAKVEFRNKLAAQIQAGGQNMGQMPQQIENWATSFGDTAMDLLIQWGFFSTMLKDYNRGNITAEEMDAVRNQALVLAATPVVDAVIGNENLSRIGIDRVVESFYHLFEEMGVRLTVDKDYSYFDRTGWNKFVRKGGNKWVGKNEIKNYLSKRADGVGLDPGSISVKVVRLRQLKPLRDSKSPYTTPLEDSIPIAMIQAIGAEWVPDKADPAKGKFEIPREPGFRVFAVFTHNGMIQEVESKEISPIKMMFDVTKMTEEELAETKWDNLQENEKVKLSTKNFSVKKHQTWLPTLRYREHNQGETGFGTWKAFPSDPIKAQEIVDKPKTEIAVYGYRRPLYTQEDLNSLSTPGQMSNLVKTIFSTSLSPRLGADRTFTSRSSEAERNIINLDTNAFQRAAAEGLLNPYDILTKAEYAVTSPTYAEALPTTLQMFMRLYLLNATKASPRDFITELMGSFFDEKFLNDVFGNVWKDSKVWDKLRILAAHDLLTENQGGIVLPGGIYRLEVKRIKNMGGKEKSIVEISKRRTKGKLMEAYPWQPIFSNMEPAEKLAIMDEFVKMIDARIAQHQQTYDLTASKLAKTWGDFKEKVQDDYDVTLHEFLSGQFLLVTEALASDFDAAFQSVWETVNNEKEGKALREAFGVDLEWVQNLVSPILFSQKFGQAITAAAMRIAHGREPVLAHKSTVQQLAGLAATPRLGYFDELAEGIPDIPDVPIESTIDEEGEADTSQRLERGMAYSPDTEVVESGREDKLEGYRIESLGEEEKEKQWNMPASHVIEELTDKITDTLWENEKLLHAFRLNIKRLTDTAVADALESIVEKESGERSKLKENIKKVVNIWLRQLALGRVDYPTKKVEYSTRMLEGREVLLLLEVPVLPESIKDILARFNGNFLASRLTLLGAVIREKQDYIEQHIPVDPNKKPDEEEVILDSDFVESSEEYVAKYSSKISAYSLKDIIEASITKDEKLLREFGEEIILNTPSEEEGKDLTESLSNVANMADARSGAGVEAGFLDAPSQLEPEPLGSVDIAENEAKADFYEAWGFKRYAEEDKRTLMRNLSTMVGGFKRRGYKVKIVYSPQRKDAGWYISKTETAYLNAAVIPNSIMGQLVLMHELGGHLGVETVLKEIGQNAPQFFAAIESEYKAGNKQVVEIVKWIRDVYGEDTSWEKIGREYWAYLLNLDSKKGIFKKMADGLYLYVMKLFGLVNKKAADKFKKFGYSKLDTIRMVQEAKRRVMRRNYYEGQTAMSFDYVAEAKLVGPSTSRILSNLFGLKHDIASHSGDISDSEKMVGNSIGKARTLFVPARDNWRGIRTEFAVLPHLGKLSFARHLGNWFEFMVDNTSPLSHISKMGRMIINLARSPKNAVNGMITNGAVQLVRGPDGAAHLMNSGQLGSHDPGGGITKVLAANNIDNEEQMNRLGIYMTARSMWDVVRRESSRGNKFALPKGWDMGKLEEVAMGRHLDPDLKARFDRVADYFQYLNRSVLRVAVQAGVVDPKQMAKWDRLFYIPIYREDPDPLKSIVTTLRLDPLQAYSAVNKAGGFNPIYAIKGGSDADFMLEDPFTALAVNWTKILTASMLNLGLDATVEDGKKLGIARYKGVGTAKKANEITIYRAGGAVRYEFDDPMVAKSIAKVRAQMQQQHQNFVMKSFDRTRYWMVRGVTMNPEYKIRNWIRDGVMAMTIAGLNPLDVLKGIYYTFGPVGDELLLMMSMTGGFFEFRHLAETGKASAVSRDTIHLLNTKVKGKPGFMNRPLDWWDNVTNRHLENANRLAIFIKELKRHNIDIVSLAKAKSMHGTPIRPGIDFTASAMLSAAYEAADLLDFRKEAASELLQVLTHYVPFQRSMQQGLLRFGRAFADPRYRGQAQFVTLMTTAAGIALWGMYKDEEWYKALPEWAKELFYFFDMNGDGTGILAIPMGFENMIPYRIVRHALEEMDKQAKGMGPGDAALVGEILKYTAMTFGDMLNLTNTPTQIPLVDLLYKWNGRDEFRDRDLTAGLEHKGEKWQRAHSWTSEPAKFIAKKLHETLGYDKEPVIIDAAIQSIAGWLSQTAMLGFDVSVRGVQYAMSDTPLASDNAAIEAEQSLYRFASQFGAWFGGVDSGFYQTPSEREFVTSGGQKSVVRKVPSGAMYGELSNQYYEMMAEVKGRGETIAESLKDWNKGLLGEFPVDPYSKDWFYYMVSHGKDAASEHWNVFTKGLGLDERHRRMLATNIYKPFQHIRKVLDAANSIPESAGGLDRKGREEVKQKITALTRAYQRAWVEIMSTVEYAPSARQGLERAMGKRAWKELKFLYDTMYNLKPEGKALKKVTDMPLYNAKDKETVEKWRAFGQEVKRSVIQKVSQKVT